jgi:hypothetical protein
MSVPGNLYTPTIRKTRGGDYLIEQSLLFDGSTTYLNRTPSTAGNRKTWTYSVWFKKMAASTLNSGLFQATDNTGTSTWSVRTSATNGGRVEVLGYPGSVVYQVATNAILRDPNAWYHVVVAFDTTQSTASDRIKIWINGVLQTSLSVATYPTQNYDGQINNNVRHDIGYIPWATQWHNGPMALPILVDGAALDPTSFGEEDDDGYWNPIEFTGADITYPSVDIIDGTQTYSSDDESLGDADNAGNESQANSWWTNNYTGSKFWKVDLGVGNEEAVTSYEIDEFMSDGVGITSIVFAGSNDDSVWTDLDTRSGALVNNTKYYRSFVNATSYRYYRWTFNRSSTGTARVEIFRMFSTISESNSFGPNGFQLDYADTADFGKDVSSTRTDLTANYVTSVSNDGGGGFATSPVTFSSVDIGTASATRKVIVGVGMDGFQGNEAYTSLTIGGVAANLVGVQNAASGGRPVALYELDVSSGTSADIVVTFTGTQTKCYSMGIGVWTIEGGTLFSTVGSTANPGAGNISVSSGGTVIAIMTEGSASATYTWANLTENFDNQVRASRHAFSGASKNLSSATTQAISATSSGGSQFAMLAASFAPANDYLSNNFTTDDQLSDTPTDSADDEIGNFATLNPLLPGRGANLAEGNLRNNQPAAVSGDFNSHGTISELTSGKWYWEIQIHTPNFQYPNCGVWSSGAGNDRFNTAYSTGSSQFRGYAFDFGSSTSAGLVTGDTSRTTNTAAPWNTTFSANDFGMVALDLDNNKIYFGKNGTWLNSGVPAAGTGFASDGLDSSTYSYTPYLGCYGSATTINFGQLGFQYTPPTGFSALATQNLPAPTIADPSDYFNTVLYTGNGTSHRLWWKSITGVGFQPDFVWIKDRTSPNSHSLTMLFVGSATNALGADLTLAEVATPSD